MSNKTPRLFASFFIFAGLVLAALPSPAEQPVRVGAILILSGEGAVYGINSQRAIELALEDIQADAGSPTLQVMFEDEPSGKVERGVAAYNKLVNADGVRIIFGPNFQDSAIALAPLAARDNVVLVSPSVARMQLPNLFTTWIDPAHEMRMLAERIISRFRSAAVLSSEQSWESLVAAQFKTEFEGRGGRIVAYEEPPMNTMDVTAQVLKVRKAAPQAVFISSFYLFPKYVRTMQAMKLAQPRFGVELDRSIIEASAGAAEGVVFIGPKIVKGDFDRRFEKRFGAPPDNPAYQAYDAMRLLAKAIKERGRAGADILGWLNSFEAHDGVAGRYQRKNGLLEYSAAFYVVRGQDYVPIE